MLVFPLMEFLYPEKPSRVRNDRKGYSFRIYTDTKTVMYWRDNLFGRSFADYPQDILMKVTYA